MNISIDSVKLPPAHTKRYVIWQEDSRLGGILVYLVGYCPDTLASFFGLFLDAQKHVPEVKMENALCTKVQKSVCYHDFTMMKIDIDISKREISGFTECSWSDLRIDSF